MSARPFPQEEEAFADDDRISYSKESKSYILEDDEGNEWEWLQGPRKWSKTMDEEAIKRQAEIYKVAGVDEDEPALKPAKKRKEAQLEEPETNPKDPKAKAGNGAAHSAASTTAPPTKKNSAVYVTGLPDDIDVEELREYFGRFGMIAENVEKNDKRIVLYNDSEGKFKGEALIIFYRPESVHLAIDMADDAWLPREDGLKSTKIHVTEADSSFKAHKGDTVNEDRSNPQQRVKGNSKALAKKKAEEMNSRLADWDDDEPSKIHQTSTRADKVVVVKGLFTLSDLAKDPDFILDLQEDLQEESEKLGTVKNVTIFDLEADGVATIRYQDAQAARACRNLWDGRIYDGKVISAGISSGEEKFRKTRKGAGGAAGGEAEKEAEEKRRLEEYSRFIEGR